MQKRNFVGSQLVSALVLSFLLVSMPTGVQAGTKKEKGQGKAGMQMLEGREMGMSNYNFDETVSKIRASIEAHQMMVMFTADHQQMLSMVGLQTPPMVSLEFFSPRYGKVIFQNDSRAALTVPLRIAIMQNDQGKVMFAYDRPSYVLARYKNLGGLGRELDRVYDEVVAGVKTPMK